MVTPYGQALAVAVCLWPVWRWYIRRLLDGADEPWGILPLLFILAALFRQAADSAGGACRVKLDALRTGDALVAAAPLLVYCLSYHFVPPLVRGLLGVAALSVPASRILRNRRFDPAVWGLLTLSLPIVASLQFYAGYPMRVAVAHGAGIMLRLSGTGVHTAGAALRWGGHFVDVDGPCSGVKALWTGALLVCLLAYGRRLRMVQVAILSFAALGVVLLGNICRAAALFHLKVGTLPFSQPWLHTGIGLVTFGGIALGILGLAHLFPTGGDSPSDGHPQADADTATGKHRSTISRIILAALCLVATLLPWVSPKHPPRPPEEAVWPETFEGKPLVRVKEKIPAGDAFPGAIAQFSDGARQILFKSVARPSRLVHPSADCYRGSGWRIDPAPLHIDGEGRRWSVFTAARKNETVRVREIVVDREGNSWSTVSAWYWSAVLNRTRPPWRVTVVAADEE